MTATLFDAPPADAWTGPERSASLVATHERYTRGAYAVVWWHCLLAQGDTYPDCWYAVHDRRIISRHRTRPAAERACRRHARLARRAEREARLNKRRRRKRR